MMKKKNYLKKNKKYFYLGIVGLILIAGMVILVPLLRGNISTITGSTIRVNYYGAANAPFNLENICPNSNCKKGVQTKVMMIQPELGMLKAVEETRTKAISKIAAAIDFRSTLVIMYVSTIPTSFLPAEALETITWASRNVEEQFKTDGSCLITIGNIYGKERDFDFGVISYLAYTSCGSYPGWLSATLKHDYLTMDGKLICSEENKNIFTIEQETGRTSKFVGC